jgi:hypothetical protein
MYIYWRGTIGDEFTAEHLRALATAQHTYERIELIEDGGGAAAAELRVRGQGVDEAGQAGEPVGRDDQHDGQHRDRVQGTGEGAGADDRGRCEVEPRNRHLQAAHRVLADGVEQQEHEQRHPERRSGGHVAQVVDPEIDPAQPHHSRERDPGDEHRRAVGEPRPQADGAHRRVVALELVDVADRGAAEGVDRLVGVADDADVAVVGGEQEEWEAEIVEQQPDALASVGVGQRRGEVDARGRSVEQDRRARLGARRDRVVGMRVAAVDMGDIVRAIPIPIRTKAGSSRP